jgi:RNA polymerase sigma-70 factor, ECF subfamily
MPDTYDRQTLPDTRHLDGLLVDVANGNRAAFESLYLATSSRLFGVCVRILPDRAEAEDVLQEVYAGIWHKARQFDPARAGAMAWLATIARNRAIDRLRGLPAPGRMAPLEAAAEVADPGASPQQNAEAAAVNRRLHGCLQQLDERRESLIRAAFFDGATYEELAARAGSPLGSVKSWIRRGLQQLRACLEE